MSNLQFTTEGQAQALAAQEAIAKGARTNREEFEKGAKATKTWDDNLAKMARTSESALRSVQTEQEKIAAQIDAIQNAVKNGIYDGREKEAEQAIERLRQKWVNVDAATIAAKDKAGEFAAQQSKIKSAAEDALGSVETDLESIERQIEAIETAADAGLIPPDEAEEGVRRLKEKYEEVKRATLEVTDETSRLQGVIFKAFDPLQIVKWGLSFAGLKGIVSGIRDEIEDLQTAVDKRTEAFMAPKERAEKLARDVEEAREEVARDEEAARDRGTDLSRARKRAGEAFGERRADIEQRIGDRETDLQRAREDREDAVKRAAESRAKAEERYAEQLSDAELQLERAEQDLRNAKSPSARIGAQRRVDDARQRLDRLEDDISGDTDASALKSSDRRIADLERDLARLRAELDSPADPSVTANAELAAAEASKDLAASRKRLAELESEQKKFQESPEYQRYQAIGARDQAIDDAFKGLAGLGDAGQLSSEQLDKMADVFRELGYGALSRKLQGFAARLDDGTISVGEVVSQLQRVVEEIKRREKGGATTYTVGDVTVTDVEPGRPLTPEERGQVHYIEQLIGDLRQSNVQAQQARDRTIQLLEQLLDKEGGIPVSGE